MDKKLRNGIIFFIAFVVLLLIVKTVDVSNGVGLYSINGPISKVFKFNEFEYKISNYLGYSALAFVLYFACLGLSQAIRRKGILKVDNEILLLGILYIIVGILYFAFSKMNINLRPVVIDGENEPSFPSSHVLLFIVVLHSAANNFIRLSDNSKSGFYLEFLCGVLLGLGVVTRFCSGVHWFTDIVGGVLLAVSLLDFYAYACKNITIGARNE